MKICSNFRDFYDSSYAFVDPTFIYKRKSESIIDAAIEKEYKFPNKSYIFSENKLRQLVEFVYVFFCGQTYCGVFVENKWYFDDAAREKYKETKSYFTREEKFYKNIGGDCRAINLRHDSPIVVYSEQDYGGGHIKKNCNLSFFNFMSIVDPYQARQTLEVFLRNFLCHDIFVDNSTNKDKILAHGYDKWSFRNPNPPTRKNKTK